LAAFWTLAFFVGPGIYVAVEQEMSRAVSSRLANGLAARPIAVRVFQVGALLTFGLVVVGIATSPILLRRAFDEQVLLLVGCLLILPGYCLFTASIGVLNAAGNLGGSARVIAGEGLFRLVGCGALILFGVRTAGPYGLAVGGAPFIAVLIGWRSSPVLLTPGPVEPWRPVSRAVGLLLGGTILNQFLLVIGPFIVKVLATTSEQAAAGRYLNAISLTRVPLFLFNAAIPILLPRFARTAAGGRLDKLLELLAQVVGAIAICFVAAVVVGYLAGPDVLRWLYGPNYELGGGTIGLLAAAAGLYCVAVTLSLALVATKDYFSTTISWALGVVCMLIVIVGGGGLGLLGRVTWGYLLGSLVASLSMAAFMLLRWRRPPDVVRKGN
jgi:O-antigen/teichoic acid export membrane protein